MVVLRFTVRYQDGNLRVSRQGCGRDSLVIVISKKLKTISRFFNNLSYSLIIA